MASGGVDDRPERSGLALDADGPKPNGVRLARRVRKRWVPVERELLEPHLLTSATLAGSNDFVRRLDVVCRAMNLGDFATAAIAGEHAARDLKRSGRAGRLHKASPDDPKRGGWLAEAPDGKGGRFRPKEDAAVEGSDARLRRLAARRGLRATLRRILTFKRATRIAAEIVGDIIPGIDVIGDAASLADAVKLVEGLAADAAETDAAIAFDEKGPQTLEDLQVSREGQGFSSYPAFRKVELEKRFGSAGDGYEYHHIVEQEAIGPGGMPFTAQEINSTANIVRIPKLLHEEISSIYSSRASMQSSNMSLRATLYGKPFAEHTSAGLAALKTVGLIR